MVGLLMILFSATMLPPMGVAWWYDGYDVILPFAEAMGAMLGLGLLCWLPVCRFKVDLRNRDGFVVVVAFWFLLSLLGALCRSCCPITRTCHWWMRCSRPSPA
jgi:trk system potassium uptake protein TrkH